MLKLVFVNNDSERFKILNSCYNMTQVNEDFLSVFNEEISLKLERNFSTFEKIEKYNEFLRTEQEKLQKEFNYLFDKAKLYFTHYYQAMHMAIERGELPESIAADYGFVYPFRVPSPKTPKQFIEMSQHLFKCDEERVAKTGKYFVNPSIGSVKVWFEKFIDIYNKKINKFNVKEAAIENIENLRSDSDKLILEIYDILSAQFSEFEINEQVEKFSEFGMQVKQITESELIVIENNLPENIEAKEELTEKKVIKKRKKKCLNQLQFDFFQDIALA